MVNVPKMVQIVVIEMFVTTTRWLLARSRRISQAGSRHLVAPN